MNILFPARNKRLIYVKVTTMDADLDAIPIEVLVESLTSFHP